MYEYLMPFSFKLQCILPSRAASRVDKISYYGNYYFFSTLFVILMLKTTNTGKRQFIGLALL